MRPIVDVQIPHVRHKTLILWSLGNFQRCCRRYSAICVHIDEKKASFTLVKLKLFKSQLYEHARTPGFRRWIANLTKFATGTNRNDMQKRKCTQILTNGKRERETYHALPLDSPSHSTRRSRLTMCYRPLTFPEIGISRLTMCYRSISRVELRKSRLTMCHRPPFLPRK